MTTDNEIDFTAEQRKTEDFFEAERTKMLNEAAYGYASVDEFLAQNPPAPTPVDTENQVPVDTVDDKKLSAFLDVPLQAVGGFRDAAESLKNLSIDIGSSVGAAIATPIVGAEKAGAAREASAEKAKEGTELPDVQDPQTITGAITRPLAQFGSVFVPGGQVTKGLEGAQKLKKFEPFLRGMMADFVAFEEHDQRLSDAIQGTSAKDLPLVGDITKYLKSDPEDGFAEGRFKNAVEGAALGGLADGLFKSVKAVKKAGDAKKFIGQAKKTAKKSANRLDEMARKVRTEKLDDVLPTEQEIRPNKEEIAIRTQRMTASMVDLTPEEIKDGKVFEEMRNLGVQDKLNKVTMVTEQGFDLAQEASDEALKRFEMGDEGALREFWLNEGGAFLRLFGSSKDSFSDVARALGMRGQSDAIVQGNRFMALLADADVKSVEDLTRAFADMPDVESFGRMADGVAKRGKVGFFQDAMNEIYINSILSSPKTLLVDTIGNPVWFGVNTLEKLPASVAGKIRQGFFHGGQETDRVRFQEAQIQINAFTESIGDGLRYIGATAKEAKLADPDASLIQVARATAKGAAEKIRDVRLDSQTKFDAPRGDRAISSKRLEETFGMNRNTGFAQFIDTLGSVVNAPINFMSAKDDVMKLVLFRASARARAYRSAANEGLKGDALKARTEELMKELDPKIRLKDETMAENGTSQFAEIMAAQEALATGENASVVARAISRKAVDDARQQTFTDELGPIAKKAQSLIKSIPGGRIVFPFVKTPTKLLWDRFLVERTPLGLTPVGGNKLLNEIKAGGSRADQAWGQLATGGALMWTGYNLALSGRITGDGPTNFAERDALLRTGWRPRSIKVGDKYVDIGRLDPLSSFLVFPANLATLMYENHDELGADLEKDLFDVAAMNTTAMARMVTSKSWLASAGQLVNAIESEDPNKVQKLLNFYASSFAVPNFVTFFANEVNPQLIQAETLMQNIQKKATATGIPRRDIFGRPVKRDPQMMNFVLPFSYSTIENDPVMQEMVRIGANIPMPKKRIEGVQLTLQDHDRLMEIMQEQKVDEQLRRFMNMDMYKMLPEASKTGIEGGQNLTKRGMVQTIYNKNIKIARERLLAESPELQDRVDVFKRNLATMGSGKTEGQRVLESQGFTGIEDTVPTFNPTGQ